MRRFRPPRTHRISTGLLLSSIVITLTGRVVAAEWLTYRGDLRRSGALDAVEVPRAPRIVWSFPSRNHFVAAPAPGGERILLPALGALNTPLLLALADDKQASRRVVWSQSVPALALPTVCSPVVARDRVLIGEGMHQNAAGAVTAFSLSDGLPLWRLEFPGDLRHVEGSPVVSGTRTYFGCGSEGIVCADFEEIRFGKETVPIDTAERVIRRRWNELVASYEKEKKSDPDFAVPPSAGDLPRGKPEVVWTAGKDVRHVDSPLALVGKRLLAGSAYLDHEKRGERALICLSADDGRVLWKLPLGRNPWGAPSVARRAGSTPVVLVGLSSIRYDPNLIDGAAGEVVAAHFETGKTLWRREIPGGVLSPVAVDESGELGVFTATDGTVRAVNTASGDIVWSRAAGTPFFAGPALVGSQAYVVDLRGRVRALEVTSGEELWQLDLGRLTGLPARVYASPLCAEGRLYVATSNLEGPNAGAPTAVVCLGRDAEDETLPAGIVIDHPGRRVIVDAQVAPRKLPHLDRVYPVEVFASDPQGKKAHETVIVTSVRPSAVHDALVQLGLDPGTPGLGNVRGSGPEVRLVLEYPSLAGLFKRVDAARAMVDRKTGRPLGHGVRWYFTGSSLVQPDPSRDEKVYGADHSGTLATVYPVTNETVFQSDLGLEEEALLSLEVAPRLPRPGTALKLIIEVSSSERSR